jgi:DNA-binding NtrC family response regulator
MKVLVLDDEPSVRRVFRRMIARSTVKVVEAGSVKEARAAMRAGRCDVLIADVALPDGDGLDFVTRTLRAQPDLKAIVLTGDPSRERRRRAKDAGAAFLDKPVTREDLAAAVDAAFLARSARAPQ